MERSASRNEAGEEKQGDTLWFLHSNTHASLIFVALQVRDALKPLHAVIYDPQITKQPGN